MDSFQVIIVLRKKVNISRNLSSEKDLSLNRCGEGNMLKDWSMNDMKEKKAHFT